MISYAPHSGIEAACIFDFGIGIIIAIGIGLCGCGLHKKQPIAIPIPTLDTQNDTFKPSRFKLNPYSPLSESQGLSGWFRQSGRNLHYRNHVPRFGSDSRIGYAFKEGSRGKNRYQKVIVGSGRKEMDMAGLSTAAKNKITQLLNAPYFAQHGFTVKYDDENNPIASIAFPASPECQFAISSTCDVNVFTTSECPGIHSDAAETLQRSSFELCIAAIKDWAERIIDRQKDWMMDEFGGVADSNPSY